MRLILSALSGALFGLGLFVSGMTDPAKVQSFLDRITSYNVCYTKLLRTRMANGCTSGHGVVGMARFSPRSIIATLVYLGTGFVTLFLARHLIGAI